VKRRDFIALIGGVAAWPLTARAQQAERMRRVGVLTGDAEDDPGVKHASPHSSRGSTGSDGRWTVISALTIALRPTTRISISRSPKS
jgi:hypothetical protein